MERSNTARRSQSEERDDSERLQTRPHAESGRARRQQETSTAAASITRVDKRDDRQREISTAPPRREGSDERDDGDSNNIDKNTVGIDCNNDESQSQETEREGQVHWLNDASQAFTAAQYTHSSKEM